MKKFLKEQRPILLLVLLLFVFHLFSKDVSNPYERPIAGDAQAYYAYLPAIFIYGDLDYKFIESHAKPYYSQGAIKDFVIELEDGERVNKTFPGVTVLYSPFFFIAHASALILGKPADGFSTIYQLWFDIGVWFYFLLGLVFMRKVLEKLDFSSKTAVFCVFFVAFGTNIFFYTIYDQSVTHVHNFFMINGLILCLLNFNENPQTKWMLRSLALLCLIGITRPTNILVLGLVLFFFPNRSFYIGLLKKIKKKDILKYIYVVVVILSLPFILWKVQTGHWIVYSYGEEGFNFKNPHFFEFLFSYTKGWMTYTPIVIPILIGGFWLLYKKNKVQFAIGLSFYLLAIYIFSSWWCWYYGAGMSQRVMIDHYILLGFLLALIIKHLSEKPMFKIAFLSMLLLFTAFNVVQAYQIRYGILKNGSATKEQYWDNFLVLQQRAIVYPKEHWKVVEKISFAKLMPKSGPFEIVNKTNWYTEVKANQQYSATSSEIIQDLKPGSKVIFSFEAKAISDVIDTRAVLLLNSNGTSEEIGFTFFIKEYVVQNEWIKMEFLLEPNQAFSDYMKVFFWNGGTEEHVQFRNIKYTAYFTEEYMYNLKTPCYRQSINTLLLKTK